VPPLPRLDPPLTDGHVVLREWTGDDVDAMTAGLADPEVARWTRVPQPYTRRHASEYIAEARGALASGERLDLAVVARASDAVIGSVSLRFVWEHSRANVGHVMFADQRGRGLGQRAGILLYNYAFERLGIRRIEALVDARNALSLRATESAGFRREALLRSYMERDGERIDIVMFAALPGELRVVD
jgi:ribosomal-protein-alanine N-acetyltransferase